MQSKKLLSAVYSTHELTDNKVIPTQNYKKTAINTILYPVT